MGEVVPAPTVGTDCTGWTYEATGTKTDTNDKYYVYNEQAIVKAGSTGTCESPFVIWTYYDESNQSYIDDCLYRFDDYPDYTYAGNKGRVYEGFVFEEEFEDFFGEFHNEREICEFVMSIERQVLIDGISQTANVYVQGPLPLHRDSEQYAETIWYILEQFNKGTYWRIENNTGCSDWYIPLASSLYDLYLLIDDLEDFLSITSNGTYSYIWTSDLNGLGNYGTCVNIDHSIGFDEAGGHCPARDGINDGDFENYTVDIGGHALVLIRSF